MTKHFSLPPLSFGMGSLLDSGAAKVCLCFERIYTYKIPKEMCAQWLMKASTLSHDAMPHVTLAHSSVMKVKRVLEQTFREVSSNIT